MDEEFTERLSNFYAYDWNLETEIQNLEFSYQIKDVKIASIQERLNSMKMGKNEDKKIFYYLSKKKSSQYFKYFTGICLMDIFF